MEDAKIINDELPSKGVYDDLPDDVKKIFLDEVDKLCSKSVNMYTFLLDQIHKHKMPPIPPAANIASSVGHDGNKIIYKDENMDNNP